MATVWLIGWDDPALREALSRDGHPVEVAPLERLLAKDATSAPDVAFLSGGDMPAVLARRASLSAPTTACVVVIPETQAALTTQLLENGAADVCVAPLTAATARVVVVRLLKDQRSRARLGFLQEAAAREAQLDDVVTDSPKMKEILERISRIARRSALGPPLSVLLTGETGTGKGLLARVLHYCGRRRDGAFIEVNCAALPATLVEAELFGHERGAFTDARAARVGLFEAAHGGTLFLDEITHLGLEGQAKLLTALEGRVVRRLGGSAERSVDVQVVAASSHDIRGLVASGAFRPELFHRLTALWFELPPLRERGLDAALLAERFLKRVCAAYRLPEKTLSAEARGAVLRHRWTGNVRELYHAIERAVLAEEGTEVRATDLALGATEPAEAPKTELSLDDLERAAIAQALTKERGNVTRAAALLKVSRDTLRSRIEKHGLDPRLYG